MTADAPHDWEAETYHRVSQPHDDWASQILGRLELRGDETALDAGCGSGKLTELLVGALPAGRVIGVDASPSMIELAQKRLPDTVELSVQDLTALALVDQVDVVVSSATFHWIADHDLLFGRLAAALRPGGRLEAQCGGAGNVADVEAAVGRLREREPWRSAFAGWDGPWNFAGPAETERRLRDAGFVDVACSLEPREVAPDDPYAFLQAVVLGAHLERLPVDVHDDFVEAVRLEMAPADGSPLVVRYVRLNISARRAGAELRPGETVGQLASRLRADGA
ncbi:methyltransferase domain-containing protein [Patulibacter brassicae]|uniref:Methyltransferase domain-containing protein n=1 Tax=Patulibacter brassicae TaxID=1705717 RepID=A0ABU4VER7_9ACTN|nr:methyltransferase domain-containing protein [Patulibacter brassicae]MDX8150294.1 methyltransferase domain-containing protein [Patulibacter brassicae]